MRRRWKLLAGELAVRDGQYAQAIARQFLRALQHPGSGVRLEAAHCGERLGGTLGGDAVADIVVASPNMGDRRKLRSELVLVHKSHV